MVVGDLVNRIRTFYPLLISPNDNARIAIALGDFVREMKIMRLNPRKQAVIEVDAHFRAELPSDMDLNGSLWVFACVGGTLYTVDINDKRCPNWVKPAHICDCADPKPNPCNCGCSEVKATCCGGCGGTIGYLMPNSDFQFFSGALGWGAVYRAAFPPIGHAMLGNPFGNVSRVGRQLIFDSCFPCTEVYVLYEQLYSANDSPIDEIYTLAVEYFVVSRLYNGVDIVQSEAYKQKYNLEIANVKTMKFLNAINPDTLLRSVKGNFGLSKAP